MAMVFPDQVALTIAYLDHTLPDALAALGMEAGGLRVCSQVPTDRETVPLLVRVQDTGGRLRDVAHETALMAVQCWARTDQQATDLARAVVSLLRSWPAHPEHGREVTTVTCARAAFYPDPDTTTPRYQATCEVTCRPERTL